MKISPQQKFPRLIATLLTCVGITGCITTQGKHTFIDGRCVTCLNNPITGEPWNYEKPESSALAAQTGGQATTSTANASGKPDDAVYLEGNGFFTVKRDVDTVYTRIKREFGFLTRKEWGRTHLYWDEGFLWEALPGVSYVIRYQVPHTYLGIKRKHYIEFEMHKNGYMTDVTFKFWAQVPQASLPGYANSIQSRALRVLR
jgi:hypothetical protein